MTGPPPQHGRQEGANPVDDAEHVDAKRPRPVARLAVPQGTEPAADAGVVDQQVNPIEARQDGLRQSFDSRGIGDITDMRLDVEAARAERRLRRFERRRLDVGQDDGDAAGTERFGQRKSDAAGRAGYDSDLSALQFHVKPLR
jgi:hypothetical protein